MTEELRTELVRIINRLSEEVVKLNKRVNDLEVKLDNIRVEYVHHAHRD